MAYVRPLVQVYQEYESLSGTAQASVLNPCIIGPCYQFMDETSNLEENLLLSFLGTATSSGIAETVVPNLFPGAVLDSDSVKLRFTEAYVDMGSGAIGVEDVINNVVEFTSVNYPTGIAVGDNLTILDGSTVIADKHLVVSVDTTAYTVSLNKVVSTGTVTTPTAHWLRSIPEFTLTEGDTGITVSSTEYSVTIGALTLTVGGKASRASARSGSRSQG